MYPNYGNRGHRPFMNQPGNTHWNPSNEGLLPYQSHGFPYPPYAEMYGPRGVQGSWYFEPLRWNQPHYHPNHSNFMNPIPPLYEHQQHRPNLNLGSQQRPRAPRFIGPRPPQRPRVTFPRQRVPFHSTPRGRSDSGFSSRGASSSYRAPSFNSVSGPDSSQGSKRLSKVQQSNHLSQIVSDDCEIIATSSANNKDGSNGAESYARSETPDTLSESQRNAKTSLHCDEEEHSNLREKLIDQLRNGTYQCLVCISRVRQRDQTWSCTTCFHIYHLSCIKLWADKCCKSATENQTAEISDCPWRCPACQTEYRDSKDTLSYFCFCRRLRNPEYHPAKTNIPHSCDEICGKLRSKESQQNGDCANDASVCTHPCTELCHPGPCPPCNASVTLSCPCGQIQRFSLCGDQPPGPCGNRCLKKLCTDKSDLVRCAAGVHSCLSPCHVGPCPPCSWILEAECYCGMEQSSVACGSEESRKFQFNPELMQKLETACAEFNSLLLSTRFSDLKLTSSHSPSLGDSVPDAYNASTIQDNQSTSGLSPSPAERITDELALNELPQSVHIRPPKPSPVTLGACFSCGKVCGRTLTCGHHTCSEPCHLGDCKPCVLDPSRCLTCPCGRVALSKLVSSGNVSGDRTNCTDPVPTCPNICARPHSICGHLCPDPCHLNPCKPCSQSLTIKCRCGRTNKELTCVAFASMSQEGTMELLCERPCNKKKACGRHKCKQKCCDLTVHPCGEICGRRLTCGQHNCEEPCHPGSCGTCWRGMIYTEITCRCGFSVLQPPQPCGAGPPECPRPCDRPHACDHPVRHTCHNEPSCPPCTVLLTKECPGGHGVQFSMPCFQPVLSCGRPCGRPLPGCSHTCQRICHVGGCLDSANAETAPLVCTQPCQKPRADCGHPCALPCHEAMGQTCLQAGTAALSGSKQNVESVSSRAATLPRCRFLMDVVCPCGRRKAKQTCYQVQLKCAILLQNDDSTSGHLSENQKALQFSLGKKQSEPLPLLACDSACTKAAEAAATASENANSRFADTSSWTRGLDLNPGQALGDTTEAGSKLPFAKPEYSEWAKNYALHNFAFAVSVERQLYNMVLQILKTSDSDSVRTVSHHFPPMKEKRRRFIHELAEFYGIESCSMDPEPGRHVMVLARRGATKFPGGATDHRGSLTALLQREFPGTVRLTEGVRVPAKVEAKKHAPATSTTRSSYAHILSSRVDQ